MGNSCPAPEAGEESDKIARAEFQANVLTEAFKESVANKRPLHTPSVVPNLGVLSEVDDVLAALVKGSESGNSAAYKGGEPYMRSNIFLAYLDQATLTLSDAERFLPPLLNLCTSLGPTYEYVSCRIVIDPPGLRIPTLQADSDMIALQIWGQHKLKVCKSIAGLPVTARRPEPLLTTTMSPGDALYVPQSLEVRFDDPPPLTEMRLPTMYAVLSLRTNDQSLGVSLGKHLVDVLRETNISKETDSFLRSALTRRTVPTQSQLSEGSSDEIEAAKVRKAEIEASLKAAVAELTQKIDAASLRDHVAKRMVQHRKEQSDGAAKMGRQVLPEGEQVYSRTYVSVAKGVVCECTPGDTKALFSRGSETLPLPIGKSASYLISELCDGKPKLVSSLTCSDPLERICVCQVLVFKKCLEICPPPEAEEPSKQP